MIDTVVPNHAEMAASMRSVASMLSEASILSPEGATSIERAANRLYEHQGRNWYYTTPSSEPVFFENCKDRADREFTPVIGIDRVEVRDEAEALPFVKWDVNLFLRYQDQETHCPRWHFDLCNTGQEGPVTHLQYGGNKHPNRPHLDVRVREPRWNVPPLDIVLLCEAVAANFFPRIWREQLRDEPRWNRVVRQSQKLCFPFYFRAMYNSLNNSNLGSFLSLNWNSE